MTSGRQFWQKTHGSSDELNESMKKIEYRSDESRRSACFSLTSSNDEDKFNFESNIQMAAAKSAA